MRVVCQNCGTCNSLDSLVPNADARDAITEIAAISGPLANALLRYLGLFRPAQRQLSFDRVATLLAELKPMVLEARVHRNGRAYAAPREVWIDAIDQILTARDRLTLPLKSHGYLLEIIAGQVNKAEATAEGKREAGRAGHTPVGGLPPSPASGRGAGGEGDRAPEKPRARPETIAATLAAAKTIVGGSTK